MTPRNPGKKKVFLLPDSAALHPGYAAASGPQLVINPGRTVMIRNTALLVALAVMGTPLPGRSAPDEAQQQILRYFIQSSQKLARAEKAEGEERYRLMDEHMRDMQQALEQMRAAKPRGGMTPEQQSEWIAEHQRLMDQAMEQMMMQYHLLMQELRR